MRAIQTMLLAAAGAMALIGTAPAAAQVTGQISDDFETETVGPDGTTLKSFNVDYGNVDVIRSGDGRRRCAPGSTICIDLIGNDANANLSTKNALSWNKGDLITLSVWISGNQLTPGAPYTAPWGEPLNDDVFGLGFFNAGSTPFDFYDIMVRNGLGQQKSFGSYTDPYFFGIQKEIPYDQSRAYRTLTLRAGSNGSAFAFIEHYSTRGSGNGLLIDNFSFSVTAVPEPATWAMMIVGVGAAGGALRRRRALKIA